MPAGNELNYEGLKAIFALATVKATLHTTAANFNTTLPDTYASTNELATSGGYTQGGVTVAVSCVEDGGELIVDFADAVWDPATFTGARYCLLHVDNDATKRVLLKLDLGTERAGDGGEFRIQFPAATAADGILQFGPPAAG